jgi:hypothetical protein
MVGSCCDVRMVYMQLGRDMNKMCLSQVTSVGPEIRCVHAVAYVECTSVVRVRAVATMHERNVDGEISKYLIRVVKSVTPLRPSHITRSINKYSISNAGQSGRQGRIWVITRITLWMNISATSWSSPGLSLR